MLAKLIRSFIIDGTWYLFYGENENALGIFNRAIQIIERVDSPSSKISQFLRANPDCVPIVTPLYDSADKQEIFGEMITHQPAIIGEMRLINDALLPLLKALIGIASEKAIYQIPPSSRYVYSQIISPISSLIRLRRDYDQANLTTKTSQDVATRVTALIKCFEEIRISDDISIDNNYFTVFILEAYLILYNNYLLKMWPTTEMGKKISGLYFALAEQFNLIIIFYTHIYPDMQLQIFYQKHQQVTVDNAKKSICVYFQNTCRELLAHYDQAVTEEDKITILLKAISAIENAYNNLSIDFVQFINLLLKLALNIRNMYILNNQNLSLQLRKDLIIQLQKLSAVFDNVMLSYDYHFRSNPEHQFRAMLAYYQFIVDDTLLNLLLERVQALDISPQGSYTSDATFDVSLEALFSENEAGSNEYEGVNDAKATTSCAGLNLGQGDVNALIQFSFLHQCRSDKLPLENVDSNESSLRGQDTAIETHVSNSVVSGITANHS